MNNIINVVLIVATFLSGLFSSTVEYSKDITSETAEAYVAPEIAPRPIETLIDEVSIKWGISSSTLTNLVRSESNFDPKALNGEDRGLVQINRTHWPEITDEQAFDPEFALNFAAEKISKGEEYLFVSCNCYLYSEVVTPYPLPKMMDILPNSNYPRINGLIVLRYKNNKHIGVVKAVKKEGVIIREANKTPCVIGERLIAWDDPALKGFVDYSP